MNSYHLIVIGGGAAGFFGALAAKQLLPDSPVLILEKTSQLLSKVRISGGGRCNVTHSCFDPVALAKHYPRGEKALIGPFTRFQSRDTVEWFQTRGVELKTEEDGRMFPATDSSQTIINCLLKEAQKLKVEIELKQNIIDVNYKDNYFELQLASGETKRSKNLLLATGSHPHGHAFAKKFGHTIQEPVPSLFTFNIPESPLKDLAGISIPKATVSIPGTHLVQTGPLLITHWGFSGPAVLRLSAWGARLFHEKNYKTPMAVQWIPDTSYEKVLEALVQCRQKAPAQNLAALNPFQLPKNLWKKLLELCVIEDRKRLSEIGNAPLKTLASKLYADTYLIDGKTTYKEEFVTCGGISLNEVDFKTLESRLQKRLFFAGEILDIDGITGGFNFQNAWTTGWLAGKAIASAKLDN
jgi:predicted Rossmann fold flavoprotein